MMESGLPILIADAMHPALMEGLDRQHFPYLYLPMATHEEVLAVLPGCRGLVLRSKLRVDRALIDCAIHLEFIARAGSGMDNVDEVYALSKGIRCVNAPEGNCDAVGEHAVGLLLSLTRNIVQSFEEVKEGQWKREENRGDELSEMTVGIIGYGFTGEAFARKLAGFGCRILFYDKNLPVIPTPYAKQALLDQVLEQADVLSFHIPLDEENDGLIDQNFIDKVSRPFYLLNLSRGGIMKTQDVLKGLEKGKIKAAAFDVLENEKPTTWNTEEKVLFQHLIQSKRVVITPHIGGWTYSSYRKISEVLLAKIETLLN